MGALLIGRGSRKGRAMDKALCYGALGIGALMMLVFLLDLVVGPVRRRHSSSTGRHLRPARLGDRRLPRAGTPARSEVAHAAARRSGLQRLLAAHQLAPPLRINPSSVKVVASAATGSPSSRTALPVSGLIATSRISPRSTRPRIVSSNPPSTPRAMFELGSVT